MWGHGSNVRTACNISLNEHFRSPSAKQKMEWRGGNLGCGSELRSARDLPFSVRLLLTRNIQHCYWKRGTQSWPLIGCSYNDRQRSGGSEACQGYSALRESIFGPPRPCPENESSPCNPSFPTGSHLLEKIPGQLIQKIGDCFR